jgi:predicted MFS family arabinose efflux permease
MSRRLLVALAALAIVGTAALALSHSYPMLRWVTIGPVLDVLIVGIAAAAAPRRTPRPQPRHAAMNRR